MLQGQGEYLEEVRFRNKPHPQQIVVVFHQPAKQKYLLFQTFQKRQFCLLLFGRHQNAAFPQGGLYLSIYVQTNGRLQVILGYLN